MPREAKVGLLSSQYLFVSLILVLLRVPSIGHVGIAAKAKNLLISGAVEKNCKDWRQKRKGKENMCLGLTLRRLEITRVNNLDVDIIAGNYLPSTGIKSFVNGFVRKSINTILKQFLFKALQKMLDELRMPNMKPTPSYSDVMAIICKHFK